MSGADIAIKVESLSKCCQIHDNPHDRLKQSVAPRLQRLTWQNPKQYFREFRALEDVSFEVKKAETIRVTGQAIFAGIAPYDLHTMDN